MYGEDRRDRIRHDGPVTLWRQIADDIAADIEAGRLRPGARLPGVLDLAETYGVADLTVRRAIRELRAAGAVVVVTGKGTYVSE